ncbi:MAG: DUF1015 domain-containing protein [Treponema sp.]|nr:DUF1015 domain-containing protein [Treponema sp.]
MTDFEKFGLCVPEILLPKNIDTKTWSVVACDQYTQDKEYWAAAAKIAGGSPSTLNLIFPEVYLNDGGKAERIQKIKQAMASYIDEGIFAAPQKEMVYVERTTAYGRVRKGLVAALDLDSYEWKPFSTALTRATEATILERIPPRMEIRRGAPLELPHIMLLANDPNRSLVEGIGDKIKARGASPLYQGELMQNSGSIKGWAVESDDDLNGVKAALQKLYDAGTKNGSTFLFAVGDGNHSLATAKAVWEEEKKRLQEAGAAPEEIQNSNVRFALVEIVNIYDQGLTFEPIHRVVLKDSASAPADFEALIDFMQKKLDGTLVQSDNKSALEESVKNSAADFGFYYKKEGAQKCVLLKTKITDLAVSRFQPALDEFLKTQEETELDYIHGADEIFRLGEKDGALGILLPPVAKDSFFDTIGSLGPLPRKSFSMGEASEKRFYLEARRLF